MVAGCWALVACPAYTSVLYLLAPVVHQGGLTCGIVTKQRTGTGTGTNYHALENYFIYETKMCPQHQSSKKCVCLVFWWCLALASGRATMRRRGSCVAPAVGRKGGKSGLQSFGHEDWFAVSCIQDNEANKGQVHTGSGLTGGAFLVAVSVTKLSTLQLCLLQLSGCSQNAVIVRWKMIDTDTWTTFHSNSIFCLGSKMVANLGSKRHRCTDRQTPWEASAGKFQTMQYLYMNFFNDVNTTAMVVS